jgi:hypothetical protein
MNEGTKKRKKGRRGKAGEEGREVGKTTARY